MCYFAGPEEALIILNMERTGKITIHAPVKVIVNVDEECQW